MKRRLLLAAGAAAALPGAAPAAAAPRLQVWRDPGCGCCGGWVEHMRAAGFRVEDNLVASPAPARRMLGTPADLLSCHAAAVGGYALEGHVPAPAALRRLAERPAGIRGLAVPGMPLGSPGMEAPGRPEDAYDVIAFLDDAPHRVFMRFRAPPGLHALPRRTGSLTPRALRGTARERTRRSVAGTAPMPMASRRRDPA